MDTVEPMRFIFASLFVLGLIGIFAVVMKRYGHALQSGNMSGFLSKFIRQPASGTQALGRLEVLEVRYLDPRRKLVLVRRDRAEHLLLLADGRETLIESIGNNDER